MIKSYKDLQVWQKAVDFSVKIYRVSDEFPKSEQYALTNQMRRASVSIASNIAEGHGRSQQEFGRYLTISLGSLCELETQMEIAKRIGYLSEKNFVELGNDITVLGKQINVLRQKVTNH